MPDNTLQGFPIISEPFVNTANGVINRSWRQLLLTLWQRTGGSQATANGVPTGMVADFAGPDAPGGWLVCDGSAVSRTGYSNLFAVIGTTWGSGDGLSSFNLPDLRNRTALGAGTQPLGRIGGSSTLTIGIAQLPAHSHGVTDPGHTHVVTDPTHTHTVTDPTHTHTVTDPGHVHAVTDPGHLHTAANANGTKDAAAGTDVFSAIEGNTGTASTGVTVDSHVTGVTNANAATGVTNVAAATGITNNTAHTGVATTDTGGGNPISILPPFAAMQKIIKT